MGLRASSADAVSICRGYAMIQSRTYEASNGQGSSIDPYDELLSGVSMCFASICLVGSGDGVYFGWLVVGMVARRRLPADWNTPGADA